MPNSYLTMITNQSLIKTIHISTILTMIQKLTNSFNMSILSKAVIKPNKNIPPIHNMILSSSSMQSIKNLKMNLQMKVS